MINFLAVTINVCTDDSLLWILKLVRLAINIICIAAPFALIIFGSIDFFKAIIAGDEKEMKAKRKPFVGRLVAALIVLLMPTIINVVISAFAGQNNSFKTCWDNAKPTNNSVNVPNIDY